MKSKDAQAGRGQAGRAAPTGPLTAAQIAAMPFQGAKIALIYGDALVVYLRDDFPHIHDPNRWDLPGGEREAGEDALGCALRETWEEFGITVSPAAIYHRAEYIAHGPTRRVAFYAAPVTEAQIEGVVFSDEGQCWRMMPVAEFVARGDAVVDLQRMVRACPFPGA